MLSFTPVTLFTQIQDEYVVFITPTALQLAIFSKILNPDRLDNIIEYSTAESLALINTLTKISNSPILLKAVADKAKVKISQGQDNRAKTTVIDEAVKLLPERAQVEDLSLSGVIHRWFIVDITDSGPGKLTALANLLRAIRKVHLQLSQLLRIYLQFHSIRTRNALLSLITRLLSTL